LIGAEGNALVEIEGAADEALGLGDGSVLAWVAEGGGIVTAGCAGCAAGRGGAVASMRK
jgi:hypothetical protein